MPAWGADPDALRALSHEFTRASATMSDIAVATDRRLRDSGWSGPDAERFRHSWARQHGPQLSSVAGLCRRLARDLERQASAQVTASAASSSPSIRAYASGLVPETTPDRQVYTGQLDASGALLAGRLAGELKIEELSGDRVQITYATKAGAGVSATAGGSGGVTLDGARTVEGGASASAAALGTGELRRTWTLSEGEVPMLIAGLVLESSPVLVEGLLVAANAVDSIGERLLDALGLDVDLRLGDAAASLKVPPPQRTEVLAGVALSAGAVASLLPPGPSASSAGVRVGAETSLAVGITGSGEQRSYVAEMKGSAALALVTAFLPAVDLRSQLGDQLGSKVRLVAPLDGAGRVRMITASVEGQSGGVIRRWDVHAELDERATASDGTRLARAFERLQRGDPAGAAQLVSGLVSPLTGVIRHSSGTVVGATSGPSFNAPGLSGALTVGGSTVDFTATDLRTFGTET